MVQLKKAVGQLDPPCCPNCRVNMRWVRSELVRNTPKEIMAHLFVCPNCNRAQRTDTKFNPASRPA